MYISAINFGIRTPKQNEYTTFIHSGLRIDNIPGKGQGIITKQDISFGEALIVDSPLFKPEGGDTSLLSYVQFTKRYQNATES